MGMKLPSDELALCQGIDDILSKDWDPIGVSRWERAPRDEYHRYLPSVFQLARKGALPSAIAEYLCAVVTEQMGLSSSVEQETPVAEKIRLLKVSLFPETP